MKQGNATFRIFSAYQTLKVLEDSSTFLSSNTNIPASGDGQEHLMGCHEQTSWSYMMARCIGLKMPSLENV